jgi:hypothetical protein
MADIARHVILADRISYSRMPFYFFYSRNEVAQ